MVGTITPMVHGSHGRRDVTTLSTYVAGLLAGGCLFGTALGSVGAAFDVASVQHQRWGWFVTLVVLAGSYLTFAMRELRVCTFPLSYSGWRVPREWQHRMPRRVAIFAYGAALGFGVLTAISSGAFYFLLVWPVLMGSVTYGVVLFAAYGVGRAIPAVLTSATTSENLRTYEPIAVALNHSKAVVDLANAFMLSACGGWLLGLAVAAAAM